MLRYQKDSLISCVIWQRNTNCNTEMVQSIATLNTVLIKKTVVLFVQVLQHEPSTPSSLTFPSYLCQVFTVGIIHNLL